VRAAADGAPPGTWTVAGLTKLAGLPDGE